jgi:hypothetical protein
MLPLIVHKNEIGTLGVLEWVSHITVLSGLTFEPTEKLGNSTDDFKSSVERLRELSGDVLAHGVGRGLLIRPRLTATDKT